MIAAATPALLLLAACRGGAPAPEADVAFVRDGLVVKPARAIEGTAVGGDRTFVARPWAPGDVVEVGGTRVTAPQRPECLALFSVDLGDVRRAVAQGEAAPSTALAFSPDGTALAVGTYRGEVLVLDAWTGAVRARRALSETMVKKVAWSADGTRVYVAEQSPDAAVLALDPSTLATRWSIRLADRVGTSAPPDGSDIFGVYSLPAAYGLDVLPQGGLLVAALHSWSDDGVHKNRSQLLVLDEATGAVRHTWPDAVADATLLHPVVDPAGQRVAVVVSRSADGPGPAGLPIGGAAILTLPTLTFERGVALEPLPPHFARAEVWEAIDIAASTLFLGFGDGRVQWTSLQDGASRVHPVATPLLAGEVPIHASVGFGFLHGPRAVVATSQTHIPWGAAAAEVAPPQPHPNANAVLALEADGAVAWSFTGPWSLAGLQPLGETLAVAGAGPRNDSRVDLYGALVLDLAAPPGADRLVATCPTADPVFFALATTPDGRIAVAEHPTRRADGTVEGGYRVTVLR